MFRNTKVRLFAAVLLCVLILWFLTSFVSEERKTYMKMRLSEQELDSIVVNCLPHSPHLNRGYGALCPPGSIRKRDRCVQCSHGTFRLPQWYFCKELLTCDDFHDIRVGRLLYALGNWQFFDAEWKGYRIVYAKTATTDTDISFSALHELPSDRNFIYPIGSCKDRNVTLYKMDLYYLGFAANLEEALMKYPECNHWLMRFHLCIDYVHILDCLHSSTGGPRVFCNSHSLEELLSQFMISSRLELVFVNFDNLPQVKEEWSSGKGVHCSKQELQGIFVAPEQKWPYVHRKVFNIDEQPWYDEKSDIWKIPDVTKALLGSTKESQRVLNYLAALHHRCKHPNPAKRPNIQEVLTEYELVFKLLMGGE